MAKKTVLKVAAGLIPFILTFASLVQASPAKRVTIMTYNVENLFDTTHDRGKNDFTFLPLALKQSVPELMAGCDRSATPYYRTECLEMDWTDALLTTKIERIGAVIRQVGNGVGPDIQILAEVENVGVVEQLRTTQLGNLGYEPTILIEGPDSRGIDTAILTKLKSWDKPQLHIIPFVDEGTGKKPSKSRGILEARLLLPDGQKVSVFAVHFPSQGGPTFLRRQAAEYLNLLKSQLPKDVLAIAGGDFNISASEEAVGGYYAKILHSQWQLSQETGCTGCQGTYYYHPKVEWSFLDALLFSPGMTAKGDAKWVLDPASIRIPNAAPEQISQYNNPKRFDAKGGISDHWPMFAEIYKR